MRISDWSSDVCSSDLASRPVPESSGRPAASSTQASYSGTGCPQDPAGVSPGVDAIKMCIISVAPMPFTNCVPVVAVHASCVDGGKRSEEHTSELQPLMRISYAVFCLKKKTKNHCTNLTCVTK